MRTLGILFLSLTPFLFALDYKANLKNQSDFILCFKEFIVFTKEQIRFSLREVNEIFALAYQNPEFKRYIFKNGKISFDNTENIAKSIESANDIRLKPIIRTHINTFFKGLGTTDTEGQINHCNYYISAFTIFGKKAQEDASQKGRLALALSLSLSLAMFIIMI